MTPENLELAGQLAAKALERLEEAV